MLAYTQTKQTASYCIQHTKCLVRDIKNVIRNRKIKMKTQCEYIIKLYLGSHFINHDAN